METVIMFIMCAVCLNFALKLSFMRFIPAVCESSLVAVAIIIFTDYATEQSKTGINTLISNPETMLDIAVILTLDVAMQLAFCIAMVRDGESLRERVIKSFLLFFPGFLIFPVIAACLVELIFSNAGKDFYNISYSLGIAILIGFPLLAVGVKMLMPVRAMRLELTFYTNCIVAMLGVIATVNGRTTVEGIDNTSIHSLGAIAALFIIGAAVGMIINKRKTNKI